MHTKDRTQKTSPIGSPAINRKKVKKVYKKRVYYSFLTIVLAICLIQTTRGAYLNVMKYFDLNNKIHELNKISAKAEEKNVDLKHQLKEYNSIKGIEALARNNLKMAGKDEVLVIIKNKEHPATTAKK